MQIEMKIVSMPTYDIVLYPCISHFLVSPLLLVSIRFTIKDNSTEVGLGLRITGFNTIDDKASVGTDSDTSF